MGISQDRLSNLPDEILEAILCLIPLKSAIRTSILSRRWRNLWKFSLISATVLDLGEEFACSQSPKDLVATISRYLQLHGDRELEKLRILFSPYDQFLSDIESWISIAARKGVKELELDLSQGIVSSVNGFYMDGRELYAMPECFSGCKSLTHLSLSRCDLSDLSGFTSFGGLQVLSLAHVDISDEMLQTLLDDCPMLESLSLMNCQRLSVITIVGPELRLRMLTLVDCRGAYELEISAPKLQTFHYHGQLCSENIFTNNSELSDAYVSFVDDDDMDPDFLEFISQISHVEILTLCSTSLMHVVASEDFDPGISMDNLLELQLLMKSMTEEHLACIYSFFMTCPSPFLQKLFIQLPYEADEAIDIRYLINPMNDPPDISFSHLKFIKMTNFRGSRTELKLVKFLLEKAVALESLVLVGSRASDKDQSSRLESRSGERMSSKILKGQLSMLRKSATEARIIFSEFGEDNCSLKPVHTTIYTEYQYLSGNLCHLVEQAAPREEILCVT